MKSDPHETIKKRRNGTAKTKSSLEMDKNNIWISIGDQFTLVSTRSASESLSEKCPLDLPRPIVPTLLVKKHEICDIAIFVVR
jgi:hypothetical protein